MLNEVPPAVIEWADAILDLSIPPSMVLRMAELADEVGMHMDAAAMRAALLLIIEAIDDADAFVILATG